MRAGSVVGLLGIGVVATGVLAHGPVAAQNAGSVEVLVAPVEMQAAPNMGVDMGAELAALIEARPGFASRDWAEIMATADLPEGLRSQLSDRPHCIHALTVLGFDAVGVDYLVCSDGRLRQDGAVDIRLRLWDMVGECWVFVPPETVADREATVAYLDSAFARWLDSGEPENVRCVESPGIAMPPPSTVSADADSVPR